MSFKNMQKWQADQISSAKRQPLSDEELRALAKEKGVDIEFLAGKGGLVMPGPGADRPLPTDSEAGSSGEPPAGVAKLLRR